MVGRNRDRGAGVVDQLEGRGVGPVQRRGGASQCAIHRAGAAFAKHFAEVGSARRRADFSVHFWRAKSTGGAAGVRIVRLAARSVRGRDDGERDYRGRDGRRWDYAAGPHGHAAFLRLQHGGLFWALAGDGEENTETTEDLSRELVPQRRGRKIPVAWIWRKRARSKVDSGARGRPRRSE